MRKRLGAMYANIQVFGNTAEFYDAYRPHPPLALLDLLLQLAQTASSPVVVDIGSGTGLSTVVWAERARAVIGIEPNKEMRRVAEMRTKALPNAGNVAYHDGLSSQTGLAEQSVDIVTCAQSFHWMEPASTLAEIARILRPGGIFAAYDYQWPPMVAWEVESAYELFIERAWSLKRERQLEQDLCVWSKNEHLARMEASGHFRFVKELWLHQQESGNADRFIGLTLTNGIESFLRQGKLREEEIGLAQFKQAVQTTIGSQPIPWYFSYCVRIGIK